MQRHITSQIFIATLKSKNCINFQKEHGHNNKMLFIPFQPNVDYKNMGGKNINTVGYAGNIITFTQIQTKTST